MSAGEGDNKSDICRRFILAVRISGAKKGNGNEHSGREGSKEEAREKETVGFAFGKNACDVHGGEHGRAGGRTYVREQFRGNVCHINRDGGPERDRRHREKRRNKGERESEKNGERYVRYGGTRRWKTLRRESNSRYNFGTPRKLKLLRAEHAELSAVFLLGTIRIAHPFLHFSASLPHGSLQVRAPSSSPSFSRGTAPFNIVGGNASGKSRFHVTATFGVKCVRDAPS